MISEKKFRTNRRYCFERAEIFSQADRLTYLLRPRSSLLFHQLRCCGNALPSRGCRGHSVYGPIVPDQRARLRVPSTTDGAHKGLQGDVLLVVDYQAGALWKRRVAGSAV